MLKSIATIAASLLLLNGAVFGQIPVAPKVQVQAEIQPLSSTEAELVVRATIANGLHVYAQSQPKPFLATKFSIPSTSLIKEVGEFVPSSQPLKLRHDKLDVSLHEHEGDVEWRSRLQLAGRLEADFAIRGSVFMQACEENLCYAPETYTFEAHLADASQANTAPENILDVQPSKSIFSLDSLEVVPSETKTVWQVIVLAFVAGLILNFLPCVLPVIGLKLLSFVQQANADRKQILLMNLAYTAGLLSVMLVLATLAVFTGLGWGEQFSSATFTVVLSGIVFAFGLSFLGVWEIPLPGFVGNAEGNVKHGGYGGAYSKGVLSTLLATPCSGPFLGAALAWAVTQPTYLTYMVFATVGLGMASPYILVGLFPSFVKFLPKPGNWMVIFKQTMGFVMLATVVYLMTFMPVAVVVPTVLLLLGIGVALWHIGRTPTYAPVAKQIQAWCLASIVVAIAAVVSFGWLKDVMQNRFERAAQRLVANHGVTGTLPSKENFKPTDDSSIAWRPYSANQLQLLVRSGKSVFVDFTADWCLTCIANEQAAIETPEFAAALRSGNVIALRADKTESNAEADSLLRRLGNSAASIPFYAFFPASNPNAPILLDGIYTSPEPFVAAAQASSEGGAKEESEKLVAETVQRFQSLSNGSNYEYHTTK